MGEICVPFSDILSAASSSVFGNWAERKITDKYLKAVKRFKTGDQTDFFPFNVKDFHDPSHIWSRTGLFGEFIMTHNRDKMDEDTWKSLQKQAGALRVPDLCTDDSDNSDFDFYEVKPASIDGLVAGLAKVALLRDLIKKFNLPYVAGISWNVNERTTPFHQASVWGSEVRMVLHFWRAGPGLVLYEICIQGDLVSAAVKTLVIAACAAALLGFALQSGGAAILA